MVGYKNEQNLCNQQEYKFDKSKEFGVVAVDGTGKGSGRRKL